MRKKQFRHDIPIDDYSHKDGLTPAEIAQVLGLDYKTTFSILARALKKLRENASPALKEFLC